MRRTIKSLGIGLLVAALIARGDVARAACDVPLVVSNTTGNANVLVILDTSGSMNTAVYADTYDPKVTYSGQFTSTKTYTVSAAGSYNPQHFKSTWPTTPSIFLVDSDVGEDGQYPGNYLNWAYFHATSAERTAMPAVTRIQAAKQAVNAMFGAITNCQFGVMVFNGSDGGTLISPIGTAVTTMQAQVNAARAASWTPLAETLVDALDYFKSTASDAPIQSACQKSFVIIVTDGFPTQDLDVPSYLQDYDGDGKDPGTCTSLGTGMPDSYNCSGYLDDVATYMYRNDLRPDMDGIQNVSTFSIGFSIDAPLLQSTADEGGGEYFNVKNVAELSTALGHTFSTIDARISAGAAVSVVSAEDRVDNRLFRARYESETWKGFVESYSLPFHSGDAPQWESGALLAARNPDTRTILTSTSGANTTAFTTSNASSLTSLLGAVDATEASGIIQYIRGTDATGARARGGWRLGDIVDAAPVMAGKPSAYNHFLGYSSFRSAHASRNEVLYVAANDGMLHCFDAGDGSELWGYVPKTQLGRLRDLMSPTYCHEYFVNLTPTVTDIYMGGAWKTVLIGGEERGGNGLFALDVTDPDPSLVRVLWDVDLPALKGSWNQPTLVRDRTSNSHVLAVGTGFSAASAQASLLALSPSTGAVLNTFSLGSAVAGNKTTKAVAIDKDFDGYDDLLYLGDLAGRLWRVDLRTNPWTVTMLFDAGRPIQAAPVVTVDQQDRPMIFFGTGKYLIGSDPANTDQQTYYGIIDDGSGATVSTSNLVNQSLSINAPNTGNRGWYLNLPSSGERITRTAALIAGTLYVPSFQPSAGACSGGGQSWLYSLDYKDGSAPSHANGSENNTTSGRSQTMGDGILADPSVDLVNEDILLQSSNAVVITQNISAGLKKLLVRSWRQKLN